MNLYSEEITKVYSSRRLFSITDRFSEKQLNQRFDKRNTWYRKAHRRTKNTSTNDPQSF